DSDRAVDEWLESVNAGFMDNPVSAFDFPMHYKLKGLCDQYGFDVRSLGSGTVIESFPSAAVTFVDNHDTVRDASNAVINDKMLAYAVVLTGEGYPCVFWQDYFNFCLAGVGNANGIPDLIAVHEGYAGRPQSVPHGDHVCYVMPRNRAGSHPGLVLVLNDRGDALNGKFVKTRWAPRRLAPVAWWGRDDPFKPADKWTDLN